MQTTITAKPTDKGTSKGLKALILLDLAASHAQAMLRMPGETTFQKYSFESSVMPLSDADGDAIQLETSKGNFSLFRVGNAGDRIEEFRTGATLTGKADNAKALLFHAIRSMVQMSEYHVFHTDVLFTTPHDSKFGPMVRKQLEGEHRFSVPAPIGAIEATDKHYRVHVHDAFSDMEGLRASFLIPSETFANNNAAILFDVGSLTGLVYCVNKHGVLVDKQWKSIPNHGVHSIAESVIQNDLLTDLLPPMPSPHQVIDVLFASVNGGKASQGKKVAKALQPIYASNFARMLQVADRFGADLPRFVVGGGASLPGVPDALNATVLGSDPQWAAMEGTAMIADKLIASKRRQEGR